MIKIENTVPPSPVQWNAVIRGMRNPMNSWDKSDSGIVDGEFVLGNADRELAKGLVLAGNDHGKFLRMLPVIADITAPFFLWKEVSTYKVGTVANSCSTMHKLTSKPFELSDFSTDGMSDYGISSIKSAISILNELRNRYIETKDKTYWRDMVAMLPQSYNQKRTMSMNYAVLRNIYFARKGHKLSEWQTFRKWIESLPYSNLITAESAHKGEAE